MNQQTLSCSYCGDNGHTIQFCCDPQIEDAFKYLISASMESLDNSIQALDDFSDILVCAIGVQKGRSLPSDTREQHREKVIDAVKVECEYLSQLSGIQRDEYMRWLYPGDYDEHQDEDQESVNSDEESVIELDDNVLVVHEVDTPCIIAALLMCIETQEELAAPAECNICFDTKTVLDMDTFQCQHPFCHACVLQMMVRNARLCCPLCRTRVKTIEVKDVDGYNDIQDPPVHLYMV